MGDINARLPEGQTAVECETNITLDHYYSAGEFKPITVLADKSAIAANGIDAATITAQVPEGLTEITFYCTDTNRAIATVPADPATHTATLQATATAPGMIRIRAGKPTAMQFNEVVIAAQ